MYAPTSTNVLDLFRLDGTAALVTGASRGLGRSMALALADAGADILAIDIENLDQVAEEIHGRGVRCATRNVDLSTLTPDSAAELFSWASEQTLNPTVLVNNAGIIHRGPATRTTTAAWQAVLDVNLTAPFLLSQAFAQSAIDAGNSASIINLASINSFQGGIDVSSYAASKHGVLGLTRALANEWAPHNIRVNAIAPGYMETEFTTAHRTDPAKAENMIRRIPNGNWGRPEDISGAVVFLASQAATYITGTTLSVDGGWLSR